MSGADEPPEIKDEFAAAVKTAGAYLQALDPITVSASEYRQREMRIMRATILKGWTLDLDIPGDPFTRHATQLAFRYLHCGCDPEVLDTLLERDCSHPAYRESLNWVICGLLASGGDVPVRLERWEIERGKMRGKWTPQAKRGLLDRLGD